MRHIWRFLILYAVPQWPRVLTTVASALVTSALLSLNFLTLVPLLKVMVEGEGLHAWLDRKICQARYGVELRLPMPAEIASGLVRPHALVVGAIDRQTQTLHPMDQVLGIAGQDGLEGAGGLLAALASNPRAKAAILVSSPQEPNDIRQVVLSDLDMFQTDRSWSALQRRAYLTVLHKARGLARYVPAGQSNMLKAVLIILIGILILTLIRCATKFYQNYMGAKIVHTAAMRIKQDVFRHMTHMPVGNFDQQRPSDYVSRVVRDANEIAFCLSVLFGPALREPLNTIFFVATAMMLDWQLTLLFLCGGPVVLLLIVRFGKRIRKASHRSLQAASEMLSQLNQTLTGLRVVKVYNRQDHEQAKFAVITNKHLKEQLRMARIEAAASPVMEVIGMAAACLAIAVGVRWIQRVGSSEFLALLVLLGAAADAARKSSDLWPRLQRSVAPAQRLMSLFEQAREMERPGAIAVRKLSGKIEFRDVYFTYPGATRPAIAGINLSIEPGQTVAIVGGNGSGKTTLIQLIPRFYDPDSGQVLIDGIDLRDMTLASLRDQIGLVTQQVITFHDTIANNIGYGRPDATDQQIIDAARQAFADEFISQLPAGYQTVIGEGGCGLSGGQLQRIAIARAILKDPPILILDEATSQIDADSETKIHQAIQGMMGRRTTIIIAHRFSTVMAADRIVVMHDGRIVDQGDHQYLVDCCPLYRALYQTQLVH